MIERKVGEQNTKMILSTVINNKNKEMKWPKNKTKKKKVWKADFDGNLDLTTEQVRKAIDWHSAVLKGY